MNNYILFPLCVLFLYACTCMYKFTNVLECIYALCVHVCVRAQDTVPLFSEQGLSLIQLGWLAGWPASLVSRVLHICPSGLAQDSTHQDRPCRCGEAGQKQAGGSPSERYSPQVICPCLPYRDPGTLQTYWKTPRTAFYWKEIKTGWTPAPVFA